MPPVYADLSGMKFGRLTALRTEMRAKGKHTRWRCVCECGAEVVTTVQRLRGSVAKSCGCLRVDTLRATATTHGQTGTRLHRIWKGMLSRTRNPSRRSHRDYGGRGVTVCDDWSADFSAFQEWALANGYASDLSIDRVNNDENYEPSNCRWATPKEQAANRRERSDSIRKRT